MEHEEALNGIQQDVKTFEEFYHGQKEVIPMAVHEREMWRSERREKRLIGIISALLALLLITNGLWIWYESQFYVTETVTTTEIIQDGEGVNHVVGGDMYGANS